MKTKPVVIRLKNNLHVRGTYKPCMKGMYADLLVTDELGTIIATKTVTYQKLPDDPTAVVGHHVDEIVNIICRYNLDEISSMIVLKAVLQQVINKSYERITLAA